MSVFLLCSISLLVSSCSIDESTTSSTANSTDNSSSSSIPSCSTYESGNTVDTEGSGAITLGNKNVSGTYSNSWQGVTPSILQEMWILLGRCQTVKNWWAHMQNMALRKT